MMDSLETMNRNLEELVRERTIDLHEKAAELERANAKLRRLDSLKSAFLSSVSHELRTPLTSIMGFVKLTRREFEKICAEAASPALTGAHDRIAENLEIVAGESEHLMFLINDVLDVSDMESGKAPWLDARIDPAEFIRRGAALVGPVLLDNPDIHYEEDLEDDLPMVRADPDRLAQVMQNLLSNAAKFSERGRVRVTARRADGGVRITVEDTGKGIAPEELENVFDMFHQVSRRDGLSDKPEGTGLGLAICRLVVEHYGGTIIAESRPGKGSVFTMDLPVRGGASDKEA